METQYPASSPVPTPDDRILPWPRVKDLAGISRTTAWRLQNAGDFPRPVVLSPGRVGWREGEVRAWRASRVPRGAPEPAPMFGPVEPGAAAPTPPAPSARENSPKAAARRSSASRKSAPLAGRKAAANQLSFDF